MSTSCIENGKVECCRRWYLIHEIARDATMNRCGFASALNKEAVYCSEDWQKYLAVARSLATMPTNERGALCR